MGIHERKEREKEARREEILNAAEKIFFSKGLPATTMDEIAVAAELSKGTLYLYYKSKEDLYLAVAMRGSDILLGTFERVVQSGEPTLLVLRGIIEEYYQYFKNHRDYFRMFYFFENPLVQLQVSPEMRHYCVEKDQCIWKVVVAQIQKGIDEGLVRSELNPFEVGVMMWSNANGLMRLMDRGDGFGSEVLHLDLERLFFVSNALLMGSMMTDKAKRLYPNGFLGAWDVGAKDAPPAPPSVHD
jgi:AcrR family transcriptional regulator